MVVIELSLPIPLGLCALTFDPFYNMHLVPVKPKEPASYSLNAGGKGWLVQITLLTAWPGLCAEVEKKAIIIAVKFCHIGRIELQIAAIHAWPLICGVSLKPLTLGLELRNSLCLYWGRWLAGLLCCEQLTPLVNPTDRPPRVSQRKRLSGRSWEWLTKKRHF